MRLGSFDVAAVALAIAMPLTPARAADGLHVGAGFGQLFTHFSPGSKTNQDPSIDFGWLPAGDMRANQVRIVDETGILLAALGTAGNEETARREATEAAAKSGAKAGDTVTYGYRAVNAAPGLQTTIEYAWGSTRGYTKHWGTSQADQWIPDQELTYSNLTLSVALRSWDLGLARLSLLLGMRVLSYRWVDALRTEVDWTDIDAPIGVALSREVAPRLFATVDADLQVFSTVLGSLMFDYWLNVCGRVRLAWAPLSFLFVEARGTAARLTNTMSHNAPALYLEAGLSATFVLGLGGS